MTSGGFSNPIIGGGGGLVYPSIHSPDFSPGPPITGWSIDKNGDAFFSGTIGGLTFEITSAGAFFYTGTPATGNLFFSVASSPGTDQYENAYGSGLNVGDQSGAHLAISEQGDLLIANSSDEPVLFIYHGDGSIRLYNPAGITAGNLGASIAPAAGSDSAGNPYPAGVAAYVTEPGTGDRWAVDLAEIATGFGGSQHPGLTMQNQTSPFYAGPNVIGAGSGATGAELALNSGAATSGAAQSAIVLEDSGSGFAGGIIVMQSGTVQVTNSDDGNAYDIQRLTLIAGLNQSITSVTPKTVTGVSAPVAAGTYLVRGVLRAIMGATAAAINVGVSGPAASITYLDVTFMSPYPTTTSQIIQTLANNATVNSASITAGDDCQIRIDGYITFSAAGTFALTAAEHTSGDSWTLNAGYLDLMPVTT